MNETRRQCYFDQCESNRDETLPEPTERRYLAPSDTPARWYWLCPECAEQIDAEADEARREGRYEEWSGGFDHLTGERL